MNDKPTRAKSALTGKWEPVGSWAMVKGDLTIAKFVQGGENIYVLFDGATRKGQYGSFADAQKEVDLSANVEFSGTPAASSPEAPLERLVGHGGNDGE